MASVALHAAVAALLLFRLPPAAPEPQKEETVKVEMVPEKKPEPEKTPEPGEKAEKPEQKPAAEAKPKAEAKPQAKMVPQKAKEKPAAGTGQPQPEEQAGKRQALPQAFESASQEGGKQAGGDRPSEPLQKPEVERRSDRAAKATQNKATEEAGEKVRNPAAVTDETTRFATLPELDLPEAANASQMRNDGEALIETAPIPKPKPQDRTDDTGSTEPQVASAEDVPADARPQRSPSELTQARELYAADALSDPRVRQALGKLPRDRRIAQICMIEAAEQIRRARPDTVPEGIFFDPPKGSTASGQMLAAVGAAYRSGPAWYDVDFHCTVNDKADTITAFRFALGGAVPESQWKARRFPAD